MTLRKVIYKLKNLKLSMKAKMILALSSIGAILLVSSAISVIEYSNMSNYVSQLMAEDISSINVANKLADMSNAYNLQILKSIGDSLSNTLPDFDNEYFKSHCDSLRAIESSGSSALADSVMYSYSAYMLTSLELRNVAQSDSLSPRDWYFDRLQPRYDRLRVDIGRLTSSIYQDLARNSATFDRGFYRSTVPGIVAVGVGLLLVFMLMLFLLAYYVTPLSRMLDGLVAYRSKDKKYTVRFDGDDELSELNDGISELANENQQLRNRIKEIKK